MDANETPVGFTEIKLSEFYKTLEDLQQALTTLNAILGKKVTLADLWETTTA